MSAVRSRQPSRVFCADVSGVTLGPPGKTLQSYEAVESFVVPFVSPNQAIILCPEGLPLIQATGVPSIHRMLKSSSRRPAVPSHYNRGEDCYYCLAVAATVYATGLRRQ